MNINKMSSKKIILFSAILVVLIASVVTAIIIISSNSGEKPSEELINAVQTTWKSAKSDEQPKYLTKIDSLSSYKLKSVEKEDGQQVITAVVTSPDLKTQLSKIEYKDLPQTEDTEAINNFLCEQIEKADVIKTEATVYAVETNGEYKISFSEEFVNAMTGNLYSYSQTALTDILQMQKDGETE